jgi:hypothetical protein
MILNGEIGRYESVRFVEQTNIAKGTFTNGPVELGLLLRRRHRRRGVVVPEEMRGKIPSDYGRSRGIAWYYVGGFGSSTPLAAQARIVTHQPHRSSSWDTTPTKWDCPTSWATSTRRSPAASPSAQAAGSGDGGAAPAR